MGLSRPSLQLPSCHWDFCSLEGGVEDLNGRACNQLQIAAGPVGVLGERNARYTPLLPQPSEDKVGHPQRASLLCSHWPLCLCCRFLLCSPGFQAQNSREGGWGVGCGLESGMQTLRKLAGTSLLLGNGSSDVI